MRKRLYVTLLATAATGSLAAWTAASAKAPGGIRPRAGTAAVAMASPGSVSPAGSLRPVASGSRRPAPKAGARRTVPASGQPRDEIVALQRDLERLINSPGRWSVMVVSLDHGDTLFSHGPGDLVAPASNMKVFTTSTALYYLGPNFRYNTFLMSTGPIENGVLKGDLVLYGTGDPTFTNRFGFHARTAFEAFADTLVALGVKSIEGSVVGDGSYFAGAGTGEGWRPAYATMSYAAPAGALQYSEGIVNLQVRPGAVGSPPTVTAVPGGTDVDVQNEAITVKGGRSTISIGKSGYDGKILIRGQIPKNGGMVARSTPVSDPAQYTASVFNEVLKGRGITAKGVRAAHTAAESPVTGRSMFAPALDTADRVRVLAIHNSPPLIDILSVVNHKSHNLMAETALRTVGRVAAGEGSAAAGTTVVKHLLEETAAGTAFDLTIVDGSGLSPLNRANSRAFIHMLSFVAKSPIFGSFWQTLPEAGARDGLHRMYRTSAEGNLRAKTGTIDNVSALSGYVRASDGEQMMFSIISNDVPSTYRAKRIEDAIGARIATFSRSGVEASAEPVDPLIAAADSVTAPSASTKAAIAARNKAGASKGTSKSSRTASKSSRSSRSYKIRKGDTLGGIAKKNGTTVAKLLKANPGINAKRMVPGRLVKLP